MNNKLVHNTDSSWSSDRWEAWLRDRLKRRFATFANEPGEMFAAYDRERNNIDDYRSRELLELLQNADDAGVDFGPNKSIISYRPEGIFVGNTGIPFTSAGVESLLISNLSPKKLDRSRHIGNRGLGFRSILGWTENPLILSGNLRLVFSSSLADYMLGHLTSENSDVQEQVEAWRAGGYNTPIPTLACPAILDYQGKSPGFEPSASFNRILTYAEELRDDYDTVIAIPFAKSRVQTRIVQQVEDISEEILLFLKHVKKLTIDIDGQLKIWRAHRTESCVSISLSESETLEWKIFQNTGIIPEEILEPGQRNTPAFEIQIAIPQESITGKNLVSYFPTKVRFPYPVIAHITMELTSNRQNLIESEANRYLAKQLAENLANVAEASINEEDPWFALRLVNPSTQAIDPMLELLGFQNALIESLKTKKIIPLDNGGFDTPFSVNRLKVDNRGWLPTDEFKDLVLWTDEYQMKQALDYLDIPILGKTEFYKRLEIITPKLSIDNRINLLKGLLQNKGVFASDDLPPILIDNEDESTDSKANLYFPPTSSEITFEPPTWMPLRFLSERLVSGLLNAIGKSRERLAEDLRNIGFRGVHPYDSRGITRALLSLTTRKCNEDPENETSLRLDCIASLYKMYLAISSTDAPAQNLEINVPVLTRTREWRNASELYIGTPYPKGILMEALFGKSHTDKFVADTSAFAIEIDNEQFENYLLWLGVSDLPKEKRISINRWWGGNETHKKYLEHVKLTAKYPMRFHEFRADFPDQLNINKMEVTGIDLLDEILQNADPNAIIAWVALDSRIDLWNRIGDEKTKIEACFRSQTYREVQGHRIPSYVMWRIRNQAWLPTQNQLHSAPNTCISVRLSGQDMQKIFPRPEIKMDSDVFRSLDINQADINLALVRLGVRMSLDELSWDHCYKLLLNLPEIDHEGKTATRIYKIILDKREDDVMNTSAIEMRNEFLKDGMLWCYRNNSGEYLPLSNGVFFVADTAVPQAIVDNMPTLDLPRGRGTDKIERLFGAKTIRSNEILLEISNKTEIANSYLLNDQLERLKPYILALRLDSTPDVSGIGRFKRFKVVPCTYVEGIAEVHGQQIKFNLTSEGELLILEDYAYIVISADNSFPRLDNPLVARYIANALSSILQIERASDFAQLAICQDQSSRKTLLSDIIGHDATDIVIKAHEELQFKEEPVTVEPPSRSLDVGREEAGMIESTPDDNEIDNEESPKESEQSKDDQLKPIPDSVKIKPFEQEPAPPKKKVTSRVRVTRSTGSQIRKSHRVTDGNRCELLAKRFEISQGRFPLRVGAIQGSEGFGCDILSFPSEVDKAEFVKSKGTKIGGILRFIEVKGRSTSMSPISLQGNELNAARIRKEKYFLYRIYEEVSNQKWQVVELCHPLSYEWEESYLIDPFRVEATKYWSVEPTEDYEDDGSKND
ncbi:DUF3883 domain-containing protein [bacterium]|nr:DUF3883 domain-containing protein [bacterium]